jgi:hypothetical protein
MKTSRSKRKKIDITDQGGVLMDSATTTRKLTPKDVIVLTLLLSSLPANPPPE